MTVRSVAVDETTVALFPQTLTIFDDLSSALKFVPSIVN